MDCFQKKFVKNRIGKTETVNQMLEIDQEKKEMNSLKDLGPIMFLALNSVLWNELFSSLFVTW